MRLPNLNFMICSWSGLADPGPVAAIFWLDDELGSDGDQFKQVFLYFRFRLQSREKFTNL